jgi:hypothetical protein
MDNGWQKLHVPYRPKMADYLRTWVFMMAIQPIIWQ